MLLRYAEYLVFVLIALVFVTQVFVPMWQGTKIFPIFRSRQRRLETELVETREEVHEAELERALEEEKGRVIQLRGKGGAAPPEPRQP